MRRTDLRQRLAWLSEDALTDIILALHDHDPSIGTVITAMLPARLDGADLEALGRRVTSIVCGVGHDWRASGVASMALARLKALGDAALQRGDTHRAADIFVTIAHGVLPGYLGIRDNESEIACVVGECVEDVGRCLAACDVPARRLRLWEALFHIYRWDTLEHGGFGMGEPVVEVLRDVATPDESVWFADRTLAVVEALPTEDWWGREFGGRLVLELLDGRIDAEGRLDVMRRTGLTVEWVEELLKVGRCEEAVTVAQDADKKNVVRVADMLEKAGRHEAALKLVADHPSTVEPYNHAVQRWLEARGRPVPEAQIRLGHLMTRFERSVTIGAFRKLCATAVKAGRTEQALGHALLCVRTDRVADQPVRVRLLARLGRFEEALAVLDGLPDGNWSSAAEATAMLAEGAAPEVARGLYVRLVERWDARDTKAGRQKVARFTERLKQLG